MEKYARDLYVVSFTKSLISTGEYFLKVVLLEINIKIYIYLFFLLIYNNFRPTLMHSSVNTSQHDNHTHSLPHCDIRPFVGMHPQ